MRLTCTSCVVNNVLQEKFANQKRKHVKSTLALCKQPKSEDYCFLLFSTQYKTGAKYKIKDNLSKVHTRFINEGKITLLFKEPNHNVFIQAETIPLKGFLHLLKQVLENKVIKTAQISNISVTPVNSSSAAPKKLVILKRSDYPAKGFPRTLEVLFVNSIRKCSLHRGILQLSKLKILDLSHNMIEHLPEEINKLPNLTELNLSDNQMGKSAPQRWNWMGGLLSKSLKSLNLSCNNLKYLPTQLIKLYCLVSLHIDSNELQMFPSGIGNLRNLRVLTAAHNRLKSLPGSARKWKLDQLDLSYNSFDEHDQINPVAVYPKQLPVRSLKEYAARKVLHSRLMYDNDSLPITLIKYLETGNYCVCGSACFEFYIKHPQTLYLMSISKNFSVSLTGLVFVSADAIFCSLKCFNSNISCRNRHQIV